MTESKELQAKAKQEVAAPAEQTRPGRHAGMTILTYPPVFYSKIRRRLPAIPDQSNLIHITN